MKQKVNHIVILRLTLLVFLITACNTQTKNRANKKDRNEFSETKKSDFELADEFLLKLKTEKADTIIFFAFVGNLINLTKFSITCEAEAWSLSLR
jgi:PBP1b-binding outer membrane lipoprotein LpoB